MTKILLLAGLLLVVATNVRADEDGSYSNYEMIVNELKASAEEVPPPAPMEDGWQDVAIHGSIGFATSIVSVTSPGGIAGAGLLKGLQLGFGMNLFSRHWRAEGAFTNYAQEQLDHDLKADLKEFELRVIYLTPLQDSTQLRFGGGLAARYMGIDAHQGTTWVGDQSTTPSSLFLIGFERKIGKSVALGPDLSYRSALVSDTFDKSAWDASFRLNATF